MKMIAATIRPSKFPDVKDALLKAHFSRMTVFNVSGSEKWEKSSGNYGGNSAEANLVGKVRIEVACNDDTAQSIIDVLRHAASTGNSGDGVIIVSDIQQCFRIRTGEEGPEAL
ncbi:MAG: P-II family nitrogen regulator [Chitinivibrionales bacterium]